MYKSYFAFAQNHLSVIKDGEEINTSAVFGFVRELITLYNNYHYKEIICVWDSPPYLKKTIWPTYKERPKKDLPSFEHEKEIIKAILFDLGIPALYQKGYEGEEIAASIIDQLATDDDHKVDFYTNDEDCYALLNNANLINSIANKKLKRSELSTFTKDDLLKKYSLTPKQFSEAKVLMGCQSDNIQGIKGVGIKTASKLIQEFKTVRGVLRNFDRIEFKNEKLAAKIAQAIDDGSIQQSRFLTTINRPKKLLRYIPKTKVGYEQILAYLEAYTLISGANKLILARMKSLSEQRIKIFRRFIQWEE
jgi:DNA polymerase-1